LKKSAQATASPLWDRNKASPSGRCLRGLSGCLLRAGLSFGLASLLLVCVCGACVVLTACDQRKVANAPVDEEAPLVAEIEADNSVAARKKLAAFRHQQAAEVLADPSALANQSTVELATSKAVSATLLDPDDALHWLLRGALYNRLSVWDERASVMAEAALNRAVELNPNLAEAWLELAVLHLVNLREQNALNAFERAIEESPALASPTVVGQMCAIYALAGESERGRDFLQEAAARTPDAPALAVGLAILLMDAGDSEGAVNQAESVVALEPVGTPEHEYAAKLLEEWKAGKP